jgi:hypothetical protein
MYYTNGLVHRWCTSLELGWEMNVTTDTRSASSYAARRSAAAIDCGAIAEHANDDRRSWTLLGIRMGFTCDESQREEILDGIARMAWTETGTRPRYPGGPAARAILLAILGHRSDRLHRIGIARLDDGGRLIGLEDTVGTRMFVLDLDVEAVHLLDEFSHRQPRIA